MVEETRAAQQTCHWAARWQQTPAAPGNLPGSQDRNRAHLSANAWGPHGEEAITLEDPEDL